jgi:outer membrane protein OmpA-like peptidoglycan-associated protein
VTGEARALVLDLGGRNGPDGIIIGLSADVLFDSGSSEIKPAADATLAKVARLTQLIRRDSILITGHTDNVGSGPSNQRLSRDRAQAVADALKDADAEIGGRAVVRGAGERQPVASNATDEGRAQNRRVEIVFRGARFRP